MNIQELKKIFIKHSKVLECSQNLNDTYLDFESFKKTLIVMHEIYSLQFADIKDESQKESIKDKRKRAEKRNECLKKRFIKELERLFRLNPQWDKNAVKRFWIYWTEWDTLKPETGLRFEKHKQFNFKRRMVTFMRNQKKFESNNNDRI